MYKNIKIRVGSEVQYDPRTVGEILHDYLENSNEPLAVAYREHTSETEAVDETDRLFKDFFPDTHLAVDLKMMTREPGRMPVGAMIDGAITHDDEDHFTFIQNNLKNRKLVVTMRNPHIYLGKFINVNRKDNGTLYPTFNRPQYTESFTFQDFCREAAEELLAVGGLIEEKVS